LDPLQTGWVTWDAVAPVPPTSRFHPSAAKLAPSNPLEKKTWLGTTVGVLVAVGVLVTVLVGVAVAVEVGVLVRLAPASYVTTTLWLPFGMLIAP
jgi:hypothetical protein